jgi:hypothetical protein
MDSEGVARSKGMFVLSDWPYKDLFGFRMNARWLYFLNMLWLLLTKRSRMLGGTQRLKRTLKLRYGIISYNVRGAHDRSQGVYIGSGIGSLEDVVKTALDYDKGVSSAFSLSTANTKVLIGIQESVTTICPASAH